MTHTQEELVKRLRAFSLAHGGEPAIDKIADDLERLTAPTQWPGEEEIARVIYRELHGEKYLMFFDYTKKNGGHGDTDETQKMWDDTMRITRAILALRGPSDISLDYKLPCDVHLPPNTTIRKGCKLETLLAGLRAREGHDASFAPLTGQEQAGARSSMDDEVEQRIQQQIDAAPEPLRRLGERLADLLQADDWNNIEPMLLELAIPAAAGAIPDGWKLVPVEATDEMLESALTNSGDRVAPYEAPRESGVPVEQDISNSDAHDFNEQIKAQFADLYRWLLSAAPQPPKGTGE